LAEKPRKKLKYQNLPNIYDFEKKYDARDRLKRGETKGFN